MNDIPKRRTLTLTRLLDEAREVDRIGLTPSGELSESDRRFYAKHPLAHLGDNARPIERVVEWLEDYPVTAARSGPTIASTGGLCDVDGPTSLALGAQMSRKCIFAHGHDGDHVDDEGARWRYVQKVVPAPATVAPPEDGWQVGDVAIEVGGAFGIVSWQYAGERTWTAVSGATRDTQVIERRMRDGAIDFVHLIPRDLTRLPAEVRLARTRAYVYDPGNWSGLDGRRTTLLALIDGEEPSHD